MAQAIEEHGLNGSPCLTPDTAADRGACADGSGLESGRQHPEVRLGPKLVFSYSVGMKNVTVTLPEETALWLRVRAAEQDRSVSRWLAEVNRRDEAGRRRVRGRDGTLPGTGTGASQADVDGGAASDAGRAV